MAIENQADLERLIEQQARKAIEGATEEILKIFKEDYIKKMVYNSHGKNVSYYNGTGKATGEFENSWNWTDIKRVVNSLVTSLFYNPDLLSHDSPTFLHGSKYSSPEDVRENLMDILNKEGRSSSLWLSVSRPQAYFDEFISSMFDDGELDKILTKHFLANGFTRV